MSFTKHAKVRGQQRGIPELVVDLLLRFGRRHHDHAGAEIILFDRTSKKKLEAYAGGLIGKLNEHMDCYAVIADGKVITVGIRQRRFCH